MNLFETVKNNVSLREAAQAYGLEVNRHGKALCPFHNDRHPSLYVANDHYYCFTCGEHGDSSASGSHFKMLFAILLQVEPYFAASSAIACSVRAKNSSMIFTSSNKVSTSSPMYYGSGGQSYRSEGKFHTFIIVHCNSIFYRLSKIVWHQSRSLGSLKIWSFGFGRVARSRGGVTKN